MATEKMIFKAADPSNRTQIIKLWEEVFKDPKDISERIIDCFSGFDNVYIAETEGHVVAQLLAVPCEASGQKGAYLYALATDPRYRGRGIMGELIEYAKSRVREKEGTFLILIPASASLFDYYEKYGFKTIFMKSLELNINETSESNFFNGKISVENFIKLRYKYLGDNVVRFDKEGIKLELEEQWYYDCMSVYCDDGYCIYLKVNDILFITEIAAINQSLARNLISYIKRLSGCDTVKITLPSESQLLSGVETFGSIKQTMQAQYKWWGKGSPPHFYLRYALDDLPSRIQANLDDIIV